MSGPDRDTAGSVLSRLLVSIPTAAAGGEGGVEIRELAEALGVDPPRLLRDFTEVWERGFYLRAGLGDQLSVAMDADRIRVWTTGEFRRPVRLTTPEAVALELGMRMVSGDAATRALSARLLDALRGDGTQAQAQGANAAGEPDTPAHRTIGRKIGVPAADPVADPVLAAVEAALRSGDLLRIHYRPAGREVEIRRLLPGLLAHAEGTWYVVGRDLDRMAPRIFRCDRILEAASPRDPEPPAPLTPGERAEFDGFLQDGRVFMHPGADPDADGDVAPGADPDAGPRAAPSPGDEARVRYDADIAPWIREHGYENVEEEAGGSLVVTHRVRSPDWLVRHVMSYAGSAEILGPSTLRARVAEALRGLH
ncbi:MAG: WYL domain-containing protein [Gemmatimonadales bacterium]|nr:MAG: WYL domain-containing protein [Gemmatimonadales bacterium]